MNSIYKRNTAHLRVRDKINKIFTFVKYLVDSKF
jgi:hypothetical protein